MSLDIIKSVFENLDSGKNWSLQLLNIKTSKSAPAGYSSRQISLTPTGRLAALVNDIAAVYAENGKKAIAAYQSVRDYDGTADAHTIYKLSSAHELISAEYEAFVQAIADPNHENDPFEYTSAYLLKGQLDLNGESIPIKLVSMRNPVTVLKHKFFRKSGTFKELSDKVLSLRPTMDILSTDKTVYFLTLAGENLFNMTRSYKAVCHQKLEDIEQADIISGIEIFKTAANTGHNPRRFIAFNESRLTALKEKSVRAAMAKQFSIPLDAVEDRFDARAAGATDKIVKLLCNKGMTDPFEKKAVEVDGARQWQ